MTDLLLITDRIGPAIDRAIHSLAAREVVFLTDKVDIWLELRSRGERVMLPQDLFSAEDIQKMDAAAFEVSRQWYTEPGRGDRTLVDGISYGSMVEHVVQYAALAAIRDVHAAGKAIEEFSPREVVIAGTSPLARAARHVCMTRKVWHDSIQDEMFRKPSSLIKALARERSEGWRASLLKSFIVEPLLDTYILVHALWRKIRQKSDDRQKDRTLIVSADPWTRPVVDVLGGSGTWDICLTGKDYRFRKRVYPDLPYLESHMSWAGLGRAMVGLLRFPFLWIRLFGRKWMKRHFIFDDISYWPLVRGMIALCMTTMFPRLYLDYLLSAESFQALGTDRSVVVLPFDNPPSLRAVLAAARQHNVRSVILQHGILGIEHGCGILHAGHFISWGERAKEWYGRQGEDISKIHAAGSPRYDAEYGVVDIPDAQAPTDGSWTVLVLTEGGESLTSGATEAEDVLMIEAVVDGLLEEGLAENARVMVKPHPRQGRGIVRRTVEACRKKNVDIRIVDGALRDLMEKADVCVSGYSTTIMEAMFYRKPSVVFDRYFQKEYVPFVSRGAALAASTPQEMGRALGLLLSDTEERKAVLDAQPGFVRYAAGMLDGRATSRVVDLLNDIMSGA